jgi:hypothetical protein
MASRSEPTGDRAPQVPTSSRDWTIPLILAFALLYAAFIHSRSYSTNDASRLASIESLVHRGVWQIDESPFGHTLDRILVDGHFVSDKPPVLSFAGAAVYALLHHGLGLTLNPAPCLPENSPIHCRALLAPGEADWAYFILTFLLVALPGVALLALAYRLARRRGFSNLLALGLVASLGLGTALFPYSTVFVNHVPAAASTGAALYLLLARPALPPRALLAASFFLALATTLDLSAGIFLVAFGLYPLVTAPSRQAALARARWLLAGALPPLLLMVALDFWIMGNPLPPQFYAAGYEYEGSLLHGNLSGFRGPENPLAYAFHLLFGDRGTFAFYPIVIWYLLAAVVALRSPANDWRRLAAVVLGATTLYFLYFTLSTDNYGGFAFSPRWMLLPVPLLGFFALLSPAPYRPPLRLFVIAGLAALSIASTYRGALSPWSEALPIFRLAYAEPTEPQWIAAVVSGYASFEEVDASLDFGANRVIRRWVDARFGIAVPDGPAWYFLQESQPPASWFAVPLGLPQSGTLALHADLTPAAGAWLATFDRAAYASEMLAPALAAAQPAPLPAQFHGADGDASLEGYQLLHEDDVLGLITGWQVHSRSTTLPAPRRVFVHLLGLDGSIAAQSDFLAADYATLFPGDLFFQLQELDITVLPPGHYWLQLGLYYPDTGARLLTTDGADRVLLQPITID